MKHRLELYKIDDFNTVKETLIKANTNFYSYTPKELKKHNFLRKGLPQSYNEQEVMTKVQEIADENLQFIKLTKFKTERTVRENHTLPIFLMQIPSKSNLSKLGEIKPLFHYIIRRERLKEKDSTQCMKC